MRDSHLLFLSNEAFTRVVRAHPDALRAVSGALIERLHAQIRSPTTASSPATSIVVIPLEDSEHVRQLGPRLAASLELVVGSVRVLVPDDMRAALGERTSSLDRAVWREQVEASHGAVVYIAEPEFSQWTDECVQYADLIVLAVPANAARHRRPAEDELARRFSTDARRTELVLLHEPSVVAPRGVRHWLRDRTVDRHHNIRVDRQGDFDHLARMLSGKATGVVFSGGGARGIAHLGVLRALYDRGIKIDAVGGASIGSIIAGGVTRLDQPEETAAQLRAAVVDRSPVDLTFPAISFARGARVTQLIKDAADGHDIEDGWLPYFCVSANLTRGALEVHDRGPGWKAVRSSFSVPGLFPPMRNDAGDVLVDGGIIDNMPVSTMRAQHTGITVLAIDVGARRDFVSRSLSQSGIVSGWRFLASSLRQRALDDLTSLPRILMRLTEMGSLGSDDRGDCYVRPELAGISLLDFDRFDELIALGERDAAPALDAWIALEPAT
jgi:predicted acylesterase/phospholipase RssA